MKDADAEGFVHFATARTPAMLQAARLLTGDWHLAQDLVQETLARMFLTWHRRPEIDSPEAYAHTVLVRTYLSYRRRRSFFESPHGQSFEVGRWDHPDWDLQVSLTAALAKLSPADRAVLVLRYLCDRSVEQVALDLDRTPASVRTQSRRALERLRRVLGPQADIDLARC